MEPNLLFVGDMWAVADKDGYVLPHTIRRSKDSAIASVFDHKPSWMGGPRKAWELRDLGYVLVPVKVEFRDPAQPETI
jgi:hypothetical protein